MNKSLFQTCNLPGRPGWSQTRGLRPVARIVISRSTNPAGIFVRELRLEFVDAPALTILVMASGAEASQKAGPLADYCLKLKDLLSYYLHLPGSDIVDAQLEQWA
jgi:hypothetical protein